MNNIKKEDKGNKDEKIVKIDIRKMPRKNSFGTPSIVMTIIFSLLLTAGIYLFKQ